MSQCAILVCRAYIPAVELEAGLFASDSINLTPKIPKGWPTSETDNFSSYPPSPKDAQIIPKHGLDYFRDKSRRPSFVNTNLVCHTNCSREPHNER
jgi:hypothetical protein